ncbi:hypothetical protein [Streptomyces viridochromogenes]|uniref:Uncharacterized protein n=1 Tax=Streptomyces viridochromogenes Tue57 TaxID=1160705 RepID=L8P9M5_STRVR|nr:hypothetical protein [Streptomyces viridochromogenes]ELS52839.1 hypothetical protein STVIR_6212 [Streptomyces viridochromogenes Tue57]
MYWYSLSLHTKRSLDHSTPWTETTGLGFRAAMAGRALRDVITSAGGLLRLAEPSVGTLNNWAAS